MSASFLQLREVAGGYDDACRAIAAAGRLVSSAYREQLIGSRVSGSDPALHRYLRARIGGAAEEHLFVAFCDRQHHYLSDEIIAEGTPGRIVARARPLVSRALALGASGFLLAHNHPSGDCRPSQTDIEETQRLAAICMSLELKLVDHLIVTRRRVLSMRETRTI